MSAAKESLVKRTDCGSDTLLIDTRRSFPGGRIDHAHHYNNAYRALDETIALEAAVLAAMSMVDLSETLIVLTADHSHVMTMGGLVTSRGNAILGESLRIRPLLYH